MFEEMVMYDPPHPGELLKEDYINPMLESHDDLTITQIAKDLGIARNTLSKLLNGHSGISPEMALRLEKAFNLIDRLPHNPRLYLKD